MTTRARKALMWLVFAAMHYGLSLLIVPATVAVTRQAAGIAEGTDLAVTLLVRLTRLLHFPLVTLALYPREWFPGNWIHVPIALNSMVWATILYGLVRLFTKRRSY
jgi:hypothetical protein